MSEQKLVSPLLDGFTLGNAISDHDGVRCYPAMKENSDEKYIVKVISVPASQVQLEALLLTGAYRDPADAMDYFKEVADGIEAEAYLLKKLSKLEGFLSFEDLQIVPMEKGRLGYEVYLLSSYKRSLERYMRRHLMTHLEAINLGLDLCQALAICRRSGHMYVDVKPSNIFISKGKEYRIGDLGFVELDSLAFTSLPKKYSSPYSPPEARDDLKTLNETVDTYGVGMVLYQVFNDGHLPKTSKDPTEAFPAPANADYELSEIIMKAVSPKVADRWQNPMEMGQALISYMQRNAVNNTPLAPPRAILETVEPIFPAQEKPANADAEPAIISEETVIAEIPLPETVDPSATEEIDKLAVVLEEIPSVEPVTVPEVEMEEEKSDVVPAITTVSDDDSEDEDDFLKLLSDELDDSFADEEFPEEDLLPDEEPSVKKAHKKAWILPIVLILILSIIGGGVYYLYQNFYLQTIEDLSIDGTQNQLVVTVKTDMDLSKLDVRCTDAFGNASVQSAVGGQVVFSDLLPDSLYRIELETTGFHKLIGKTAEIFTTDALANIVAVNAITGPEDGSVVLNFTVDGDDPEEWSVLCEAEGETAVTQSFTGHSVTVTGLTVGKKYTITLGSTDGTEILGNNSLEFTASRLVMADDLSITTSENGTIIARWTQPDDVVIESWTARCYNNNGHEQVKEVTGNEVVFTEIDSNEAYTIEVTAYGMTEPSRISITANPITVTNHTVSEESGSQLTIHWNYTGNAPDGGWLLMYTLDNNQTPNVVKASDTNAVITPRIAGATYHFELQAANSTTILGSTFTYSCAGSEIYDDHGVSAEKITASLLKTPEGDWLYDSVDKDSYTDVFASGEPISVVLRANTDFYLPHDDIEILYVIRDKDGNVLSELIAEESTDWYDIWFDGDYHAAELDIPKIPATPGEYTVSIYFNHLAVTSTTFSITE